MVYPLWFALIIVARWILLLLTTSSSATADNCSVSNDFRETELMDVGDVLYVQAYGTAGCLIESFNWINQANNHIVLHARFRTKDAKGCNGCALPNIQFDANDGNNYMKIFKNNLYYNYIYELIDDKQLAHIAIEIYIYAGQYKIYINNKLVNYEFKFEQYDKKIEFDDIKAANRIEVCGNNCQPTIRYMVAKKVDHYEIMSTTNVWRPAGGFRRPLSVLVTMFVTDQCNSFPLAFGHRNGKDIVLFLEARRHNYNNDIYGRDLSIVSMTKRIMTVDAFRDGKPILQIYEKNGHNYIPWYYNYEALNLTVRIDFFANQDGGKTMAILISIINNGYDAHKNITIDLNTADKLNVEYPNEWLSKIDANFDSIFVPKEMNAANDCRRLVCYRSGENLSRNLQTACKNLPKFGG